MEVEASRDRWRVARALFENGKADLRELACLMRLASRTLSIRAGVALWRPPDPDEPEFHEQQAWRESAAGLAIIVRQTLDVLRSELADLSATSVAKSDAPAIDGKTIDGGRARQTGETRLKALLALTKGIQALEETIARLNTGLARQGQYPADLSRFNRKIEKRIRQIAKSFSDDGKPKRTAAPPDVEAI